MGLKLSPLQLSFPQDEFTGKPIAVGWSGGADSTALLLHLKEQGYDVYAWHVDHGWSELSSQVAAQLKAQAEEWDIPFFQYRVEKPCKNIEAEARNARYQAFECLAEQAGCYDVALAHHEDDQAETVCMRLLQGAGIAGCQGMKVRRQHRAICVWRPLLKVSKQSVLDFLLARNIDWHDDPSNQDCSLWRNKIRLNLFPAINKTGVDAKRLFLRWQAQAEKRQQMIEQLATAVTVEKFEFTEVPVCSVIWQQWCEQPQVVRVFVLQQMIGLLFAEGKVFGRRHILAIEQWKQHGGNGWLNLSGCCMYRQGQSLQLCQGNTMLRNSYTKI